MQAWWKVSKKNNKGMSKNWNKLLKSNAVHFYIHNSLWCAADSCRYKSAVNISKLYCYKYTMLQRIAVGMYVFYCYKYTILQRMYVLFAKTILILRRIAVGMYVLYCAIVHQSELGMQMCVAVDIRNLFQSFLGILDSTVFL